MGVGESDVPPVVQSDGPMPAQSRSRRDAAIERSALLTGLLDEHWFVSSRRAAWQREGRDDLGRRKPPAVQPAPRPWYHSVQGVTIPMPEGDALVGLRDECRAARQLEAPRGPCAAAFLERFNHWHAALVTQFQGGSGAITGALGRAAMHWVARMQHLPEAEQQRWSHAITRGLEHPWEGGSPPPKPIRYGGGRMRNHRDLHQRPDAVWKTLSKMFSTRAARFWDTRGGRRLPQGMHPIRWVRKGDTNEVRITYNFTKLNENYDREACTVDLETASRLRHRVWRNDDMVGLDLSSSFYHAMYSVKAATWTGAAVRETELPAGVWCRLRREYPHAYCHKEGVDWLVFVLDGIVMGASPSVRQFQDMMDMLLGSWQRCPVGRGRGTLESWRATVYIDDLQAFVAGGFGNALELSLRLVAEMVILGFTLNLKRGKSQILPSTTSRHIGYVWDTRAMMVRLPDTRVQKMARVVRELRAAVVLTDGRPRALGVAKLVGLLWSGHMCMPRAVAICCRGLIDTLSVLLRTDALREAARKQRFSWLKALLKGVWGGVVTWTSEADADLRFWERIDFAGVQCGIAYRCLEADFQEWCWAPTTAMHPSVVVAAADTSETASGGACFVARGGLWEVSAGGMMVVQLQGDSVGASSCFRECVGILALDLACIPAACTRAVVFCDNQATVSVLSKGSKVPQLNELARQLFERSLAAGRVLHFVWIRRSHQVIEQCDAASRLSPTADFVTPERVFWRANAIAMQLWGRGLQFDRFASVRTACPRRTAAKLLFNSQWLQPGTAGRDAFAQHWVGYVNWVAAPFCQLVAVFDLMRGQQACGAVMVPWDSRWNTGWAAAVEPGAAGWRADFKYQPGPPYRGRYAIVFVDYQPANPPVAEAPSAEQLQ